MQITFGQNIRKLRIEKKMTQEDLANKLFVTRQTISSWENNKSKPDYDLLVIMSKLFEIELSTLIDNSHIVKYSWSKRKSNLLIALGVVSFLFIIVELFVQPLLLDVQKTTYKPYLILYKLGIHPVAIITITVFLLMLITKKFNLCLNNKLVKKIFFVLSISSLSLFYACWIFVFFAPIQWLWVPFKLVLQLCYNCSENNILFIIIGTLLFLGVNQNGHLFIQKVSI